MKYLGRPLGARKTAVSGSYSPSVRNWSVRNGWVVPPLRRLSSIAYELPRAVRLADGDEVHREAPDHSLARQPLPDLHRVLGDRGRVRGIRGKDAAEVALAARAAEQLVVRRQHLEPAERRHAHLDARRAELLARDPLLDDAAAPGERVRVPVERDLGQLELHRLQPFEDLRCPRAFRKAGEVDDRVPLARHALVELDDHLREPGPLGTELGDRLRRLLDRLVRPSRPAGWGTPCSANSRRQPVFVP